MVNHTIFSRGIEYDYMNILTWFILKKTQILNGCETFMFKYIIVFIPFSTNREISCTMGLLEEKTNTFEWGEIRTNEITQFPLQDHVAIARQRIRFKSRHGNISMISLLM